MSSDPVAIRTKTEFFALAKFDGDRKPGPPASGNDVLDRLNNLQDNLTDPQCTEIIAGGDGRQTAVWRKVNGSN